MSIEQRLAELKLTLPPLSQPIGTYVQAKQVGDLLYLSGKGPRNLSDGSVPKGKLGAGMTIEQGYAYARDVGLMLIASMKHALGDLDRVGEIVKLLGMVNAAPDFEDHPKVINGCSDLFVQVFGEAGRHARSAVGMSSLPGGIPVEIEAIVRVKA
jgi:enamine deaminase RidA (YjgF/YER057c/UK114 family)